MKKIILPQINNLIILVNKAKSTQGPVKNGCAVFIPKGTEGLCVGLSAVNEVFLTFPWGTQIEDGLGYPVDLSNTVWSLYRRPLTACVKPADCSVVTPNSITLDLSLKRKSPATYYIHRHLDEYLISTFSEYSINAPPSYTADRHGRVSYKGTPINVSLSKAQMACAR